MQVYKNDITYQAALLAKPIVFIVHGWLEAKERPWVGKLAQAWLDAVDVNVIVVDWEHQAAYTYSIVALRNIPKVGAYLCSYLQFLKNLGVSGLSMTVVGHSFGGQVAGYAGACLGDLGTIYALDAAGPLFTYPILKPISKRLDSTDANWVSAIHTSAIIGALHELGDSDFYMDGGTEIQCGCFPPASDVTNPIEPLCSHSMSITYTIHTLDPTKKCKGIKGCSVLLDFIKSKVCAYDLLSILSINPYKLSLLNLLQFGTCEYDDFGIYSARKPGKFFVPTKAAPPHCFG